MTSSAPTQARSSLSRGACQTFAHACRGWVGAVALALLGCSFEPEPDAPPDCSVSGQNAFLYDLMKDVYLWADQTPEVDPQQFESPQELLEAMAYRSVDRWSGISKAEPYDAWLQRGQYVGLGYQLVSDDNQSFRIALVHRGSPAEAKGLRRGMQIVWINGKTTRQIEEEGLWGSIYGPNEVGVPVDHLVVDDYGNVVHVRVQKDVVAMRPVHVNTVIRLPERTLGYLMFTGFLGTSDAGLRAAFEQLRIAGVDELVLDLRYNSGGFISMATLLGSLIAGPKLAGQTFALVRNNDAHRDSDSEILFAEDAAGIGVRRLFAITGPATASASELVINSLRPYIDVKLIGATTHGKPVGANTWHRCELAMTPITFRLLNANGEGDYFDGLEPDCQALDDLRYELGDQREARLAAALALAESGTCPAEPEVFRVLPNERTELRGMRVIRRSLADHIAVF